MNQQTLSKRSNPWQNLVKRQALELKQLKAQLGRERWRRKRAEAQWHECQRRERSISYSHGEVESDRLELSLQASETQLRDIFNSANAAIVSFRLFANGDWEYEYSSPGSDRVFGYTAAEMLADRNLWLSRVLPEDRDSKILPLLEAFLREETVTVEYRFHHKDDSIHWISATYTSRRDEAAKSWVVTLVATDISRLKRTEASLRQYERIISATPDGIALVDLHYRYQSINRTYLTWHFKRREEVVGYSMRDLLGDDTFENVVKPYFQRCLQGEIIQYEAWCDYRTQRRFVSITYAPYMETDGTISGVVLSLHDLTELKRAEEALQQSEERFRLLVNASPVGIFQTDARGNCTFVNPRWLKMAGLSSEEARDRGWGRALHPDDRDRVWREWNETVTMESEFSGEYRFCTPEGRVTWIQGNSIAVRDAEGIVIGYLGTVADITERKFLELALSNALETASQAESKLNDVLNTAPVAIVCYRLDSALQLEYEYCSGACERVYGYTPKELTADPNLCLSRVHPEDLESIVLPSLEASFAGSLTSFEFRFRHRDGSWRWLSETLASRQEGECWIVTAAIADISDRKHAEAERNTLLEAIERSQTCLRTIVEAVLDGLLVQDREENIQFINPAAIDLLGLPPDDWQAYDLGMFVVAGDYTEVDIATATGTSKTLEVRSVEIHWQDRPAKLIVLRDITTRKLAEVALQNSETQLRQKADELQQTLDELKSTQTQLVQSEKMSSLGQLVAGVAHEINNPVSFIYGNVEHLSHYVENLFSLIQYYQNNDSKPSSEIRELESEIELDFIRDDLPKLIASMRVGSERIRAIVLSLRNFSRLDRSRLLLANLHEGLDNTLLILNHRLKARLDRPEIEVIRNYGNLPEIFCYAGDINQVFMNIISNAIDALEDKVASAELSKEDSKNLKINIETRPGKDRIQIKISDNGLGIPPQVKSKIFDPFFTTKPVGQGTGLGLSISYQIIVEKHGGTLDCISHPDRGTEFIISLPLDS